MDEKGEIVLYQPEGEIRLEVRVENETVWLTQAQMAELFDVQRQAITKHIKNIIETHELEQSATSSILELVQKEGRRLVKRPVTLYNLDMIISVGFRVNTQRGIRFRRWANQILKDFMLKGYAVRQRKIATDLQIVDRLHEQRQLIKSQQAEIAEFKGETEKRLSAVEQRIDFFVTASQTPTGGILTTGTRFDGFVLIADLIKSAKRSVVFIDPYATIEVLKFAAIELHNRQYLGLEPKTMRTIHDRFLLVDDTVYHFGASFKDMGNEMTAFSVLDFITPAEVIEKIQKSMKGR